jgi:hypothetical protein
MVIVKVTLSNSKIYQKLSIQLMLFSSYFLNILDLFLHFFRFILKIHYNISFYQYFQFLIFFVISLYFLNSIFKAFLKYLFIFIYNKLKTQNNVYIDEYFEFPRLNQDHLNQMQPQYNQIQTQQLYDTNQAPPFPQNKPPSYEHIYSLAEEIINTYNAKNH